MGPWVAVRERIEKRSKREGEKIGIIGERKKGGRNEERRRYINFK